VPVRKIKKSDTAALTAHEAEHDQAFDSGKSTWETLRQLAVDGKASDFKSKLSQFEGGTKAALKLPRRLVLKLVRCKRCCSGSFQAHVLVGQGQHQRSTELARVDVQPEFVRAVLP
jgi:hypothetical protein